MKREGKCIQCGMCCGDEEFGWCVNMEILGKIGEPYATSCQVHDRWVEIGRPECLNHPIRPEEIYPWYKCGYRFVNDGD